MATKPRTSEVTVMASRPRRCNRLVALQRGGDWVELRSDTGATLAFQRAPDHQPPVWPSTDRPQQAHLGFDVEDLDQAEAQVLAIGARKAEHQPGTSFRVFLDPAGHPFCLVRAPV